MNNYITATEIIQQSIKPNQEIGNALLSYFEAKSDYYREYFRIITNEVNSLPERKDSE